MPVPQGGWRLGLHGPGAISHRGIPIPKGDGVLALWPRPHPPLGNTPKGGGVLAFMASSSSPIGGNPSPLGMGSWPYGLGLILTWGTVPQGGWRLGLHGLGVISHRGKWRVACGMWRDLWRVYNLLYFYLIFYYLSLHFFLVI